MADTAWLVDQCEIRHEKANQGVPAMKRRTAGRLWALFKKTNLTTLSSSYVVRQFWAEA